MTRTRIRSSSAARLALATALSLLLAPACATRATAPRPNFVLFLVDMLRPDHLGLYGYDKETSPNLDRAALRGVTFERAYAPAPWTLPSTVSLLSGLYPSEHGADELLVDEETRAISFPEVGDLWLTDLFRDDGYRTVAVHSHRYLHRSVSDIHTAFDDYYYAPERFVETPQFTSSGGHWTDYIYLDTVYPIVESWLRGAPGQQPFFMYVHVIDVHGPYNKIRLLPEDEDVARAGLTDNSIELPTIEGTDLYVSSDVDNPAKSYLYDGYLREADRYFGRLLDLLTELGIADNTYVVFAADHGEGFGEHDDWGHGREVYEEHIRIPLVFTSYAALATMPRRVETVVNTVGLLPTLASLAGIDVPDPFASRRFSAVLAGGEPAAADHLSYTETSRRGGRDSVVSDGGYKLITEWGSGIGELFDLERDPAEQDPLVYRPGATGSAAAATLVDRRVALRAALTRRSVLLRNLDPESLEQLRALGYIR